MTDNRTIEELLQAPTKGYGEVIVIPKINADHLEIKTNLLQLVQANPYQGFERENPHTHINNFKRITSTLKFKFKETFGEAWEQFKEMLRACPHHEFTELAQIATFYNGLNDNDQDSLNVATGGNLLSKTTREFLQLIENKSKVRYSRNKPNVSRMNTTSRENASKSDDRVDKLADQISTLVDIFAKKVVTTALVKAVEESCVTCGGPLSHYICPNTDNNQPSVYVATGTYNQVAPQNRASNYMAPPGFVPVQNDQNRFHQKQRQAMADNRTMKELLQAPTKGYGEVIVILEINADHFEIKTNLLQLVQANPYQGFVRENPHTHINNFKRITSTLIFRFKETFGEAWERFKEMLRACPQHEFTELAQIATFYNGLNDNDQDSLNVAAGGNLLNNDKLFELAKIPLNENCSDGLDGIRVWRRNIMSISSTKHKERPLKETQGKFVKKVYLLFAGKLKASTLISAFTLDGQGEPRNEVE
nr:hypothetical protein [Tanacetum cinerariifolium]